MDAPPTRAAKMTTAQSKRATATTLPTGTWDAEACKDVIAQLWALRAAMLANEESLLQTFEKVDPCYRASARNLSHYLTLRHADHAHLQEWLAGMGLSSLGRSESNVLANVDKVLGILHRLTGQAWEAHSADEPVGIKSSKKLLDRHTVDLLGDSPKGRSVRIMVTLPSEAATDYALIRTLVASGMDIARINCAHDGPAEWKAMASHVRRASRSVTKPVRILMDLGGPKLRTGHLPAGAAVLKLSPERDDHGLVLIPACVGLRAAGSNDPVEGVSQHLSVEAKWLAALKPGDELVFDDARASGRTLHVVQVDDNGAVAECWQTAYLVPDTCLRRVRKGRGARVTAIADLPVKEGVLHLHRGDTLRVTKESLAQDKPQSHSNGRSKSTAPVPTVSCTLPEIFAQVSAGERIWFDDGRIGAVIQRVGADWLEAEITQARDSGEKLLSDKGINLPDSRMTLPALTEKDLVDLHTVVKLADLVGLSFVQQASDVEELRTKLNELAAHDIGIMLKIETRRAFDNLPALLFSAMAAKAAGVMIARGDLAVECGYENLAEIQEEILWAAEAAHMPVIWATQVLETLAKTGLPSRAEITDAAMGERAECVMLNKGPHITDAMRMLDDILGRMQAHQLKRRPLLKALSAWDQPGN